MKKIIIAIVVIVVSSLTYWLASPFFIDKRVSEEFPTESLTGMQSQVVLKGKFGGFDSIHTGSGDVAILKTEEGYIIRFEDNFDVANGPDLYVGLGKDGEYKEETQIAPLKGNIGSQNYIVPASINLADYNEVWIWCRAFSAGFARASLNPNFTP